MIAQTHSRDGVRPAPSPSAWLSRAVLSAAVLLLTACSSTPPHTAPPSAILPPAPPAVVTPPVVAPVPLPTTSPRMWLTTADAAQKLAEVPVTPWQVATSIAPADPATTATINVDPATRYQVIAGFGAAITDASAWLINQRMSAAQRSALIDDLFSHDRGIGLSLTRLTIGASDFSRHHYSYSDRPGQFDLSPVDADVLPVTLGARRANPGLLVMASPWSAPAWMKTSNSLIQGRLDPAHHAEFAVYLRDYLRGMAARGVPIDALSIQNEPHFEPTNYPGMRVMPEQRAAFIGQHLGPLLEREGLTVKLLDWDHNWDEPQSPQAVLSDATAARYISGVAWHCYAGDVSAQSLVHDAYPDKDVWFTECSGGEWEPNFGNSLGWMTRTLIIGTTRNWARGVLLWNIALDADHGPHLGGCGNCRGVVTIDQATGAVTRNVEYYVLAHASRFVRPGARRIASDSGVAGVDSVAFRNEDDGSLAIILANGATSARQVLVRQGQGAFVVNLPAGAVATISWPGS